MMKRSILLALMLILSIHVSLAQIPQTMSYQGILTDAQGNAIADGNVSLTFRLYDVATEGSSLWDETISVE